MSSLIFFLLKFSFSFGCDFVEIMLLLEARYFQVLANLHFQRILFSLKEDLVNVFFSFQRSYSHHRCFGT